MSTPKSAGLKFGSQRALILAAVSTSIGVTPSDSLNFNGFGGSFGILKEWLTKDSPNFLSIFSL